MPCREYVVAWVFLFIAGLLEIVWAVGLKYSEGFSRLGPSAITIAAMGASFWCLARALKDIPLGTGYAIWVGIGAVGTAAYGMLWLGEDRSVARMACFGLILMGIVGMKLLTLRSDTGV